MEGCAEVHRRVCRGVQSSVWKCVQRYKEGCTAVHGSCRVVHIGVQSGAEVHGGAQRVCREVCRGV